MSLDICPTCHNPRHHEEMTFGGWPDIVKGTHKEPRVIWNVERAYRCGICGLITLWCEDLEERMTEHSEEHLRKGQHS